MYLQIYINDEFMRYEPQTKTEKVFKELLTKEIQRGIADFYWLRYGSSFNADGSCATLKNGDTPAVGKSYNWCEKVEKEFKIEQRPRSMRVAYIGVLIKKLVEDEKWSVGFII